MRVPTLLLFAATALAACGTVPRGTTLPGSVLLVGVVGLDVADSLLAGLPGGIRTGTDVFARGRGAAAAVEFLGGRGALEQLRGPADPLAWVDPGTDIGIDAVPSRLLSSPEWAPLRTWQRSSGANPPRARVVRISILERAEVDAAALRRLFDRAGTGTLVVVAGLPAPFPGEMRTGYAGAPGEVWRQQRVPVLAAGPGSATVALDGRRLLGDALAPLRGEAPGPPTVRQAHWWQGFSGGFLVDTGEEVLVAGTDRETALLEAADPWHPRTGEEADARARQWSSAGDLLVLVRGSEAADLAGLRVSRGDDGAFADWGLEPIDVSGSDRPGETVLALAAEPQGDGVLVVGAAGTDLQITLLDPLEDAPLLGAPIRDAGDGAWLSVNSLEFRAWSRDYWRLTRRVDFDTGSWWTRSTAGVDLLWVHENEAPPVPVRLDP